MKRFIISLIAAVLVTALFSGAVLAESVYGVIKTPSYDGSVNVRSNAGVQYPIVGWAKNGWQVEILYYGNKWHKVRVLSTGQKGYVSANYVRVGGGYNPDPYYPTPEPAPSYGTNATVVTRYAGSVVNLREGPGTWYAVASGVKGGTSVSVLGQEGGWYKIYVPAKGRTGWISASYIRMGGGAYITGDVNLRYGPSTSYSRMAVIHKGESITVVSAGSGWSQVSWNGMTGYISNKYWAYR